MYLSGEIMKSSISYLPLKKRTYQLYSTDTSIYQLNIIKSKNFEQFYSTERDNAI